MNIKDYIDQLESLKQNSASMLDTEDPEGIWQRDVETLQFVIKLLTSKDEKLLELLKLMVENPELPVVAMVDSEIVADDGFMRWKGAWGSASLSEYITGDDRIYFRDDDDIEEALAGMLGCDAWDGFETEEEAEKAYVALPWVKCIAVDIDLPDCDDGGYEGGQDHK